MASLSALRRTSSSLLRKTLSLPPSSSTPLFIITFRHRFTSALFNRLVPGSGRAIPTRFWTTTATNGESPPIWVNPAAEADDSVIIEGCDFEHWLVIMRFPADPKPSDEEMVDTYIKTLAAVVGSKEEAKKKIYSVSTTTYTGFGALVSRELSKSLKGLPGVLWVLPDSYLDVPSKDYGGDLLVDGKIVPRPEYRFRKEEPEEPIEYQMSESEGSGEDKEHEKGSEDALLFFKRLTETIENFKQSESEDLEGPVVGTKGEPTKNVETMTDGGTEDFEGRRPMFDSLRKAMKTAKTEPSYEDLEETADDKETVIDKETADDKETAIDKETVDDRETAVLFDRLREKIMNTKTEPPQESKTAESEGSVEKSLDEEKTAALFDRLREHMKNVKIDPAKSSGKDLDWPDMLIDEYYEKAEDPGIKMTQEQLDAMKVQIQEFKKELMQCSTANKDG